MNIGKGKRFLSAFMALVMVFSLLPVSAFAVEADDCGHHAEHTAECGYVAAVAGADCTHEHNTDCGYAAEVAEVPCACAAGEDGVVVHAEGCGYVAAVAGSACTHAHDESCGYVAAVAGAECAFDADHCHDCEAEAAAQVAAVQAVINALPAEVNSEAEVDAVWAAVEAIDAAMEGLTAEQAAQLDLTRYDAAIDAAAGYTNPEFDEPTVWAVNVSAGGTATVEKLDTTTVSSNDLLNSGFSAPNKYSKAGVRYRVKDSNATWVEVGTALGAADTTLTHGTTYEVQERYYRLFNSDQFSSSYYVTFKEYHNVTASVDASANAGGAGKVTAPGKVYHNEKATITVTDVDGYKAELYNGDTKVADLNDEKGWTYTIDTTASVAYTVKYIEETATEYPASVVYNENGNWGTASLNVKKGIAGAELVLTVTPAADTNSAKYTYTVSVENGSYNDSTGKVTVAGTGDVVVTVTFSKVELSGKTSANVKFNPKKDVDKQLNELKEEIFNQLNVSYFPDGVNYNTNGVKYEYLAGINFDMISNNTVKKAAEALGSGASGYLEIGTANPKVTLDLGYIGEYDLDAYTFAHGRLNSSEKIRISYKGLTIEATITLVEGRGIQTVGTTVSHTQENPYEYTDADALNAYVASIVKVTKGDGAIVSVTRQETPTGALEQITYLVNVSETSEYQALTDAKITIWAKQKAQAAKVTFVSVGEGSGTVQINNADPHEELIGGTHQLKITPVDLDGSNGNAMYVASVAVNGGKLSNAKWVDGVYYADLSVENGVNCTVTITYATASLTNIGGTLELNGYEKKKFDGLKNNIINAVLGGGTVTDYNVHVWADLLAAEARYYNLDDDRSVIGDLTLLKASADRLVVPEYGKTGTLKVKIIKAASSNGQIVSLTLADTNVTTKESRGYADASLGAFTKEQDTENAFIKAVQDAVSYDNGSKTGLTVSVTKVSGYEYEITYTIAESEKYLKSTGNLGKVTWNANSYTVKFVDENNNELKSETLVYGATITAPTAPAKEATAEFSYEFDKWVDENDKEMPATVEGAATYHPTYKETKRSYTITWVNGDKTTTETYEYDATPVAPEATKSDDKADNGNSTYYYTNGQWPTIATVTGDATYTATFTKNAKEYTVTWIVDGVETTKTHAYGTKITVSADPAKEGYTFAGWTPEVVETMGAGDVTYTATWTVNEYTVTWVVDGVETTESYDYGAEVSAPETNPSKDGYNFAYWAMDGAEVTFPYTVKGNVTITAKFTQLVAKVGDTLYETLAEAIAAAETGDTVILLANNAEAITVDKNLTLDLNGNQMTGKITLVPGVKLTAPKNLNVYDNSTYLGTGENRGTEADDGYITVYENGVYERVVGHGGTWGGIDWIMDNGKLTIKPTVVAPVDDPDITKTKSYEIGYWPEGVKYYANGLSAGSYFTPYNMDAVTALVIEEGVTSIGSFAAKFKNLDDGKVVIPWTVTYIGCETFQNAKITELIFQEVPEGEIGEEICIAAGAFKSLKITEATLPADRAVHLHASVFQGCSLLEHVTFPETVRNQGDYTHVRYYYEGEKATGGWDVSTFADASNLKTVTFANAEQRDAFISTRHLRTYYVAYAGNVLYFDLAYAFSDANNGVTLKLIANTNSYGTVTSTWVVKSNVTIINNITVDNDGKTVTVADGANLTIKAGTYYWDITEYVPEEGYDVIVDEENGTWTVKAQMRTITFKNWDDTVLWSGEVAYDSVPKYTDATPAKAATAQYTYTFAGWDPEVAVVTGDATYTAQFKATVNKYTVTFVDGNGNTVQSGEVEYGTTPEYKGATPTKTATAQYTYTFKGWDKEIVAVTADVTYTAQFDATVNKYTVTWVTGSGTKTETYEYGATPVCPISTAKPTADGVKYTFTGWDNTISTVTGNATYTAQYSGELAAKNGTVGINKWYTNKSDKTALTGLRTNILTAAGLTTDSRYVVTAAVGIQSLGDWATWTVEINDNSIKVVKGSDWLFNDGYLANELNKSSYSFVITDTKTGYSKTVTMQMTDSRPSAGLVNKEITDVKVLGKNDNPTDYINTLLAQVNPNGLNVTVTLTEGTWPPAQAGVTYKYVYTVSYESDANWIGGSATLTVYMQSLLNNCTVVPGSSLTAGGGLTVNGSNDNKTVAGNSTVSITVKPSGSNVVETITVYKNGVELATFNTNQISYSSKNATVSFNTDGTEIADVYTVEATYSQNYLNLVSGTIVYCMDNDDLTNNELKALVFGGIFGGSSAPMNAGNVTLEYAYIGVGGYNLWQDISKGPAINLGSLTHKFGETGSETIRIKYSDDKYGSFEQTVTLNVFDSCYSSTVAIQTIAPEGTKYNFSVKYSADSRTFQGVSYFKQGDALTVTLTPSGDDIGAILEQLWAKTYSETSPYIKDVKVYKNVDGQWVEVDSTLERGNGELVDWDNILGGIGNPFAYTAAVTFTPAEDTEYKVVAEYDVLKLERYELSAQMPMYQAGKGYDAEVPTAQEIVDKFLGKAYAANFIATHGGAWTVEFSTDIAQSTWTAVTDEALLALYDGTTVRIRITWNPDEATNKTYYPVATTADLTLVDLRAATNVQGSVPTEKVEYVEEAQLIENLKKAMGLGILSNGALIEVEYDVNYTIRVVEAEGNFATVVVTYHGSENYKPCQRTFENVPVADIPDNATMKVTIAGAAVNVTNNAGAAQNWDPSTELYTVIGNGTYVFTLTPAEGKAIEAVYVNGEKLEAVVGAGKATQLFYKDGVATFTLYLTEKVHYEITVETVDSVWVLEDECVYDFAYGVQTPVAGDIVDQITTYPTDIDFSTVDLEYLARAEGKVTITLPDIDLGFTSIELGSFDVELGELWAPVDTEVTEYDLEKLADELVNELIEKIGTGEVGITDAYSYIENKLKTLTLGAHKFGVEGDGSTETVRFSYADDKYTLAQVVADVTIKDNRIATEIVANDCEVTYGYSLEQLIAASGAVVNAEGAAINVKIDSKDLYMHAGDHAITLYFAGDETYQPAKVTINVTVNKASVSVNYDSQYITYGDKYEFALTVDPTTLPDGTASNPELIEFMIGLDVHNLITFNPDSDNDLAIEGIVGLEQAIGFIQLRLPEVIRELPLVGEYLQGEFTLSEFTDLINQLSDVLGIDESSIEILNQVMEAITGITDRMDIKVIISEKEFHPTNMGIYIAGAVTIDSDFETAYTADYLIIAPKTIEVEIDWNTAIDNYATTLPAWNVMDKGAAVVGDPTENFVVKTIVLGVNTDDTGILSTDIYGKIKANLWLDPADVKDNGAYVQIAFGAKWGNELYYAVPIVRAFAIVPGMINVELVGSTGEPNSEMLKTFNNQPQGFSVIVTDMAGEVIYSDHYQNIVAAPEHAQVAVYYLGVQTNGEIYKSTEKPVHAGVYTAFAVYLQFNDGEANIDLKNINIEELEVEDLYQLFDLESAGVDAGLLVIEPSESTIVVDEKVVEFGNAYDLEDLVEVGSVNTNLKPDTTIISAMINSNGSFAQNGWEAIEGSVNVDFPKWMDAFFSEYAPDVIAHGITVGQLIEKLNGRVGIYADKLIELGATNEIANAFGNLIGSVTTALENIPADSKLTFEDDVTVSHVGAYAVIGIVTDSDHYPSVDAGILVIVPDVDQVYLNWNYEDENGIWTRELLKYVDLFATAYNDEAYTEKNDDATAKITYQFIGIDKTGELKIFENAADLPNGAYIQLAYIELSVSGKFVISDMIARPVVIVPGAVVVEFVDKNGNINPDQKFVFDNTEKEMGVKVTVNGEVIVPADGTVTYTYIGIQTNGKEYNSTVAPTHAGVYVVTATYNEKAENGSTANVGVAVGIMAIEPAQSSIDVTGSTVTYDGNGHTVTVETTGKSTVDYTLISGGAYVSGDIDEIGVDAFHGNVNIDFPRWLDEALAEYEFKSQGVDTAYLIRFITAYRSELIELMSDDTLIELGITSREEVLEKLNAFIDELLPVLEKLPKDVTLTFNDDVTYNEPGYYFYYGIVTDSDHYPSTDTGLLVIEKQGMIFDLTDTTVTYNGEEQFVQVDNGLNADYVSVIIDRAANTVNLLIDEDAQYLLNSLLRVLGKDFDGNVNLSTVLEQYSGAEVVAALVDIITELETRNLSAEIMSVLAAAKAELEKVELYSDVTLTINGTLPTEAGEYEIYAISYSEHYATQASKATLVILPVQVEVILDSNAKVYGDADPELTYTVYYYDHEGNLLADAGIATVVVTRVAGENAGTCTISAMVTLADSKNYTLIAQPEDTIFTIEPAELTVTVDDQTKNYGTTDPELTYTVECSDGSVTADELGVVITREAGENVGEYTINATYNVSGNYVVNVETGTLTITKATASVDVNDATKVYGEVDPTFAAEVEGLKFNDELNITFTREAGENVGEYIITATASDDNYDIIFAAGKLTITKATATVDVNDATKAYGEVDPTFTANVEGLKFNDQLNITFTREAGQNVGEYVITAVATDDNYEITFATGTLSITKATATIVVDAKNKSYGSTDPELTYTVTGLVDGETESVLNIAIVRVAGENVGTYAITATATNDNYDIQITNNVLTITKATVTIVADEQNKVYGETDPTLTYEVSGLVNGETKDILNIAIVREAGENVGAYAITITASNDNYDIQITNSALSITKRDVTITVSGSKTICVNGSVTAEDFAITVENAVEANPINVIVDISDVAVAVAGEYTVTVQGVYDTNNYNVDIVPASVTVREHSYDAGVVTTTPTCEQAGVKTFTCQYDEAHTRIESVAALGHDYNEGVITTKPTCTEDGVKTFTCQNDATHSYTQSIPAGHTDENGDGKCDICVESLCKNHVAGEYVKENVIEATCTTTGSYDNVQYCIICDAEVFRHMVIVPLNSHKDDDADFVCDVCGVMLCQNNNPVILPAKAPTCTESGLTEGSKCADCGQILVAQQVIPALGHLYEGVITTAPGCTTAGVKTYTCQRDAAHTYTVPVSATGHKDANGDYKCDTCGYELCSNHVPGMPVVESQISATCTRNGSYDTVVRCALCDVVISRVTTSIPATGHKDENSDKRCDVCNTSLCEEHAWDAGVVTDPSCAGQGYTTYTCTECGDRNRETMTGSIPAHKPDNHWHTNSSQHYNICTDCGQRTESYSHTFIISGNGLCKYCIYCGYTTNMKVVAQTFEVKHIPTALQDTYATVEAFKKVMDDKAQEQATSKKYQILGSLLQDVELDYLDPETGEWVKVDESDFPEDGKLTVSIPVPAGIDLKKYQIHVTHMFASDAFGTIGDMEHPEVTVSVNDQGEPILVFTVTGLSPVLFVVSCANDHATTEVRDARAATCYAEGYTGDTYCTTCGEKVATGSVIGKIAHTPAEPVKENETAVSYEEVVYCSVSGCRAEISRTLKNKAGATIVCVNTATGVYYADLSDALDAASGSGAETIQVLNNVSGEQYIIVAPGTTLDLNGYTVEGMFVVGLNGSNIVDDSTSNSGLLKTEKEYVILAEDNRQFPVYTGDGYVFASMRYAERINSDTGDILAFLFKPQFGATIATYICEGAESSATNIAVRFTWLNGDNVAKQDFVYNDSITGTVYAEGSTKAYTLAVSGLATLEELTCDVIVVSDTGVIWSKRVK